MVGFFDDFACTGTAPGGTDGLLKRGGIMSAFGRACSSGPAQGSGSRILHYGTHESGRMPALLQGCCENTEAASKPLKLLQTRIGTRRRKDVVT